MYEAIRESKIGYVWQNLVLRGISCNGKLIRVDERNIQSRGVFGYGMINNVKFKEF